jgi:hypothetical protein
LVAINFFVVMIALSTRRECATASRNRRKSFSSL